MRFRPALAGGPTSTTANRVSNAIVTSAAFPYRETPSIPTRRASTALVRFQIVEPREAPQAQALKRPPILRLPGLPEIGQPDIPLVSPAPLSA